MYLLSVASSSCAESGNAALKRMLKTPKDDAVVPTNLTDLSLEELTARASQWAAASHAEVEMYEEM